VAIAPHQWHGLQRPVAGQKFGMMRLTTFGRRSGRTRLAIVG
jgi:hypothetical protein